MADKYDRKIKDIDEEVKKIKDVVNEDKKERGILNDIFNIRKKLSEYARVEKQHRQVINKLQDYLNKAQKNELKLSSSTITAIKKRIELEKKERDYDRTRLSNAQLKNKIEESSLKLFKASYKYLMENDKVIKQTIVNLGLSAAKADTLRFSFEQSAAYAARLGGNLEDVAKVITEYADETGRARALSGQMIKDIITLGKGTGLGVENAAKLGAQFELIGSNATNTLKTAQGIIDNSEHMGVNATAVFKKISANFKDLQKYTFTNGVQGIAKMAEYAEKFKIDMAQALNSAEMSRNLEHAIDLAANLQVLGGQFAKVDPFQLLYSARNNPAQYQKMINNMTKGIATFRKNAQGAFELFISPADQDRLRQAEKVLGLQAGELSIQAKRMAEIQKMRQQMAGMGLTKSQRTLVEGMAIFNNKTGRFTVQIGNASKDMANLTANDLKLMSQTNASLESRAKQALTFDETFKATINQLKTVLLPFLRDINMVLVKVDPYIDKFTKWVTTGSDKWIKIAALLGGAGAAFSLASKGFDSALSKFVRFIPSKGGSILESSFMKNLSPAKIRAGGELEAGIGKGKFFNKAGVGLAAVGIGAGLGLAASGISKLADSMAKLDKTQINALPSTIYALAGAIAAFTVPLAALGAISDIGLAGFIGIGAAALGVGEGLNLAARGMGFLVEKFGVFVKESKGSSDSLFKLAAGVAALGSGLALFSGGGILGLAPLTATLGVIALASGKVEKVGNAFKEMTTNLVGHKDDFIEFENLIKALSNANFNNMKPLNNLAKIFSKPLEVRFADKNVSVVSNITLNIDGYKLYERLNIPDKAVVDTTDAFKGRRALKSSY